MIDTLNQAAAIAARDGVERGIANIEARIKIKLDGVNEAAKDYFARQMKADKAALAQLTAFRAELNRRVFDAYKQEAAQSAE
jgi:hypothetical protein